MPVRVMQEANQVITARFDLVALGERTLDFGKVATPAPAERRQRSIRAHVAACAVRCFKPALQVDSALHSELG